MRPTPRYGSRGDAVVELQKGLNMLASNVTLTEENFIDPSTKAWTQEPWIDNPAEKRKSWCGLFCVYCYRKADIRHADIGVVARKNHHFLIESVDGSGPAPGLTTIDGNQWWGRILRVPNASTPAHRVLLDNFNYYSIT
jgi:hypothetical protein